MSVAIKKGAKMAAMEPMVPADIYIEPFSLIRKRLLERPGAVKGAPLLGAAKQLDDEQNALALSARGTIGSSSVAQRESWLLFDLPKKHHGRYGRAS
jgi:hypothetical protein